MKSFRLLRMVLSKGFWLNAVIGVFLMIVVGTVNATETAVADISSSWAYEDGSGFAVEVFQAVKQAGKLELDLEIVPFARALKMFNTGKSVCFMGGDERAAWDYLEMKVLVSDIFLTSRVYAFTLRDQPKITAVEQLRRKRVGARLGLDLDTLELKGVTPVFDLANTNEQNMKKLQRGRIDVIVSYEHTLSKEMLQALHYDSKLQLYTNEDSFLCQSASKNQRYIDQFNKGLRIIRDNGILQHLYNKYYSADSGRIAD